LLGIETNLQEGSKRINFDENYNEKLEKLNTPNSVLAFSWNVVWLPQPMKEK